MLCYTLGHLTGVEAQVFVNVLQQVVHSSAYLGGMAAVHERQRTQTISDRATRASFCTAREPQRRNGYYSVN
jgi:hypothetical protein